MRIFLTGCTGFIGSYVLAEVLEAGHEVLALRRTRGSIPKIPPSKQLKWCEGDLLNLKSYDFDGVDVVLHLASAGVSPKPAIWSQLEQDNVLGSINLMKQAAASGVQRFVVAGTSHEYGSAARLYEAIPPDAPLEPLNPYGASKAAAYQLMRTFSIVEKLEFFYGRIFYSYGDGQFGGNFWPSLNCAALAGNDFPMTSGTQIMDFIPVRAVAKHLLASCSRPDVIAGQPLVVNIGSGVPMSLLAFAKAEWARLGAKGRLLPGVLQDRPDQIERYVPDLRGLASPKF